MAPNTDTLTAETSTTIPEVTRPSGTARGAFIRAAVIAACVAMVAVALIAVIGGDDDSDVPTTRLDPQAEQDAGQRAEEQERQAHLEGQAKTHGAGTGAVTPGVAASQDARWAQAERYERQAHLDGQAFTYGRRTGGEPESTDQADTSNRSS